MDTLGDRRKKVIGKLAVAAAVFPFLCSILSAEERRWKVSFQGNPQKPESAAVAMSTPNGPVLVSVAVQGTDFSSTAVLFGGKPVNAKLVGYDAISRLCFFKPQEAISEAVLPWEERAPDQDGTALTLGTGHEGKAGTLKGKVNRIGDKILPLALLKVQTTGDSPAPGAAVAGMDGRIMGIVFQAGNDNNNVYAIPAEAVHRVAKDVLEQGRLVRGWLGVSLMVENSEPRITKVWAGSPAADAGLREGDLITRIGNRRIVGYVDVADAFFYLVPNESVEMTIVREGKTFRFALTPTAARPY